MPYKDKSQLKQYQQRYQRRYYQDNKEAYQARLTKNRQTSRDWLQELKSGKACIRCGETFPQCLHFHHRNPDEKKFQISNAALKGYSIETIKKEIEKCDVLCANCHIKEHYKESLPL